MKTTNLLLVLALSLSATAMAAPRTPGEPTPLLTRPQDQLIAVLKSDAAIKDKMDACRELAVIGNAKAVPVLVALLAEEKLNHNARYALETMPGAGVNAALRAELPRLKGRQLAGVIATLGVRRDAASVGALKKSLANSDSDVVQGAARSLGQIGTRGAANAIQAVLPSAAAVNRLALYEGWMHAAEILTAKKNSKAAIAIYDRIRATPGLPAQVRLGAVKAAILARGNAGNALLTECLWTGDYTAFAGAVQAAMQMRGAETTAILAACATGLKADNQILILQALGRRGAEAVPVLADFAEPAAAPTTRRGRRAANPQDTLAVRLAAVRALAETDQAAAVPVLVELLGDADKSIAQAAQDGLAALTGKEADNAALTLARSSTTAQRILGLELIGSRRMTSALDTVVVATGDAEAGVRHTALKRWGALAEPSDLLELLQALRPVTNADDLSAAEAALSELCSRAEKPDEICDQLIGVLSQAQPIQKATILNVLGSVGSAISLPTLRASLSEPAEVRAAALKALAEWPESGVLPDLLALAQSGSESEKALAFRGYVRLVGESGAAPAEKVKQLREVAALAASEADKKVLLGGLGEIVAVDSLNLAAAYLADAALADEAGAAVVKIAGRLPASDKEVIGVALNQVLKSSKSESVLDKARKRMTALEIKPE